MNNFKNSILIGGIIAIIAVFVLLYSIFNTSKTAEAPLINANINEQAQTTPTPSVTPTPSPTPEPITNAKTYTDPVNNYSFSYPQDTFKPFVIAVSVPFGKREVVSTTTSFKHEINTEYCAPSGVCQPTTVDMSFGAAVLQQSLETIKKENPEFKLLTVQRQSIKTQEYSEGAEGEGMAYYFFPLTNGKTLMMYQRNISEKILTKYQSVPEFLKIDEQMRIMDSILASIQISK